MSDELIMALMELERDEIVEAVKSRVEKGEDSLQILDELRRGARRTDETRLKGPFLRYQIQ